MPESQHTEYKRQWNPDIANAFFRAGLIESWGRGIERIKDACTQNGYPTPTWTLEPGGWWVTFGYAPEDVAQQVTGQVTEYVQRLLSVMVAEHSRSELQRLLNLRHRDSFIAVYLQPALAAGLVEMTLPNKPTSRMQKYRLTEAGHQWQAAH